MAQVFSRRAGFYIQLVLLALLVVAASGVVAWRAATDEPNGINETVDQPVPFSHKHHVGDVGLDCRYCHASVETAAYAGMPSIHTCLTCHSQLFAEQPMLKPLFGAWQGGVPLPWRRVNQLPDFVYFDHSIHIAKGVGCVSCHGRVDRMPLMRRTQPLSMAWCLECHRDPAPRLRPHEKVFDMEWRPHDARALGERLVEAYRIDRRKLVDCSVCHR